MVDFDPAFDFASDTPVGKDPDEYSPTLRRYHRLLWSKPLPSGGFFSLDLPVPASSGYLIHARAGVDDLYLGSDAITNSYSRWRRPSALAAAIASLSDEQRATYLDPPYTVGSAMVWPVRSKDRPTINQARGTRGKFADRMDLTLECVRRHYTGEASPLGDVLRVYGDFFELFVDFRQFVDFFHFQDLVDERYEQVRLFLPRHGFERHGAPGTLEEYVALREGSMEFIGQRGRRMAAALGQLRVTGAWTSRPALEVR